MKFYRIERRNIESSSLGFEWVTSQREATAIKAEFIRMSRTAADEGADAIIETVEIEPTKAGILAALNRYASHPDNG